MYEQIARNKRLAGVYMAVFFAIWVGIGGFIGLGEPDSVLDLREHARVDRSEVRLFDSTRQ